MSETGPRRRRRPQNPVQEPEAPHRIVIDSGTDEPDWLVSAGNVSGAASRRAQSMKTDKKTEKAEKKEKPEPAAAVRERTPARTGTPEEEREDILLLGGRARSAGTRSQTRAAAKTAGAAPKSTAVKKKTIKKKKGPKKGGGVQLRGMLLRLLAAAVVVTLCVIGAAGGARLVQIKQTLDLGDGVFYPNLFVNDIPLEGKTLDEAAASVTQQVTNLIASWRITLRTQDGRSWDITGEDLKMQYDVADQLDQLWAIGHTGSSADRYEQVQALMEEPIMRYTTLTYDMSMVNQILTQIKNEVDRAAVSATRVYDDSVFPPYTYTDDVPGQELDITGLNEQICAMVDQLESGVVDLTPTTVQAPVTRAQLEGQIVKLSTYETKIATTSTEGRFENIRIGTEKFDHLTIKSGESVSFNKVTGKRTAVNGFQVALELAYGQYVEGVGGGICQVSSTLYNAVINAGLEVTKRTQHSRPSSYVPLGLDATVSDDRLDFVFKNTTSADIFIESKYYNKGKTYYCQFTIYGRPDPNGYTYKLESQVRETLAIPEPTYKKDTDAQYVIYTDDEPYVYSKGEEGYVVDVYLVTMDSKGLEVSRELKYTDTYKAAAPVYYVGVTVRETPEPFTSTD
ncbi:MAG: VanW family protein [Candidatus Ventricola sp.]|nr:VanW family protein [Candidatus Ventricola sp.]